MVLYNVTVQVDSSIDKVWRNFITTIIAPEMIATGYFTAYRISKLLFLQEDDGFTYSIQYEAPSMKHIQQYELEFATEIREKHSNKFGEKALVYRTMMEVIAQS